MEKLYRVNFKHATFGIIVQDNKVVKVAPIAKFIIGWNFEQVINYIEKQKGKIQKILKEDSMEKGNCKTSSCSLTEGQIGFIKANQPSVESDLKERKLGIKIKIFGKKDCNNCKTAVEQLNNYLSTNKPELAGVTTYYDIDTLDGLTEAAVYTALDIPTIVVESISGKELNRWSFTGSHELSEQDLKNLCDGLSKEKSLKEKIVEEQGLTESRPEQKTEDLIKKGSQKGVRMLKVADKVYNGSYAAVITGADEKFGFKREFLETDRKFSKEKGEFTMSIKDGTKIPVDAIVSLKLVKKDQTKKDAKENFYKVVKDHGEAKEFHEIVNKISLDEVKKHFPPVITEEKKTPDRVSEGLSR